LTGIVGPGNAVVDLSAADSPLPASSRLDRTNLLVFRTANGEATPVRTINDWQRRRAEIIAAFQSIAGPMPGAERNCPLDVKVEAETDCGDYLRQFLTYASEPGSRVPAYLLIPKSVLNENRKAIGMLCLHQTHPKGQKVVVGLGDSPNDEYGVELVRRGYVCLAPPYPLLADYDPDLKSLGYLSGTMKAIRDNRRAIGLLESLPFVERGRVGAIGHSLGGHNAIFTALFEDRIKAIAVSCSFDSFIDYKDGDIRGWTSERYMPRLLEYRERLPQVPFDFPELLGAIAPRAIFVSAPMGDTNFKWRSVDAVAQAAAPVFKLYSATENLKVVHPDCEHLFPREIREVAYQFLDRQLQK
jgi:pimeloyl-ACP methyl ester carboxylesterase